MTGSWPLPVMGALRRWHEQLRQRSVYEGDRMLPRRSWIEVCVRVPVSLAEVIQFAVSCAWS